MISQPIDLHFGARERAIGVYLVDTDDGLGALRLRPDLDAARARSRTRRARRRAGGRPASPALAHPPRPRRRGRPDRPQPPRPDRLGLRDRRAAPHRPVATRALGTPALRRSLRPAVGRARAGPGGERPHRRAATCSAGTRSDAGPRVAPRQLPPRRHAARGRRGRRTDAGRARTCFPSRRRRTSTSRPGTRRRPRSARATPERLALIHFGVHEDVDDAPRPARVRARPLGRARARRHEPGGVRRSCARRRGAGRGGV